MTIDADVTKHEMLCDEYQFEENASPLIECVYRWVFLCMCELGCLCIGMTKEENKRNGRIEEQIGWRTRWNVLAQGEPIWIFFFSILNSMYELLLFMLKFNFVFDLFKYSLWPHSIWIWMKNETKLMANSKCQFSMGVQTNKRRGFLIAVLQSFVAKSWSCATKFIWNSILTIIYECVYNSRLETILFLSSNLIRPWWWFSPSIFHSFYDCWILTKQDVIPNQ